MTHAPIRMTLAAALCILPAIHAAQADTVIRTKPLFLPGLIAQVESGKPGFILSIHSQDGTDYQDRRLRAPRTWRTAGPMAKRHWRTEQPPRLACPAPIKRCTTDGDCERRNPCVLAPRHSF